MSQVEFQGLYLHLRSQEFYTLPEAIFIENIESGHWYIVFLSKYFKKDLIT